MTRSARPSALPKTVFNSAFTYINTTTQPSQIFTIAMPGQLPLTGEEAQKYAMLMQKSVRVLREEAKRANLCAGAKTKSELAYSMVKEKRPRRITSETSSEDPLPNSGIKCEGLDRGNGTRYPPLRGIASHLQQQHPFPPKYSPAELLAGPDARGNPFQNREAKSTRHDSLYQTRKNRLYEDAEMVVAHVPRAKRDSVDLHRDRLAMADHRRRDFVSAPKHSQAYPGCTFPQGVKQSHETEPRQRLCQPLLCTSLSNAGRGRHGHLIEGQGRSPSTQRLEHSHVIYRPSPAFDRSATLAPIQHTSGGLSSPSYERHASEPIDSPRRLPTEDRTLPPIREALSFLSW